KTQAVALPPRISRSGTGLSADSARRLMTGGKIITAKSPQTRKSAKSRREFFFRTERLVRRRPWQRPPPDRVRGRLWLAVPPPGQQQLQPRRQKIQALAIQIPVIISAQMQMW